MLPCRRVARSVKDRDDSDLIGAHDVVDDEWKAVAYRNELLSLRSCHERPRKRRLGDRGERSEARIAASKRDARARPLSGLALRSRVRASNA